MHLAHQSVDILAAVVPRHARVQVLPQPLDLVRVRAVRWQEVQLIRPAKPASAAATIRLSWMRKLSRITWTTAAYRYAPNRRSSRAMNKALFLRSPSTHSSRPL